MTRQKLLDMIVKDLEQIDGTVLMDISDVIKWKLEFYRNMLELSRGNDLKKIICVRCKTPLKVPLNCTNYIICEDCDRFMTKCSCKYCSMGDWANCTI